MHNNSVPKNKNRRTASLHFYSCAIRLLSILSIKTIPLFIRNSVRPFLCRSYCSPLTPVPLPRCPDPSVQAPDPCGWRDAEDRLFHTCRTSRSISPFLRPSNPFPMPFLHGRRFRKCGICSTVRSSAEYLRHTIPTAGTAILYSALQI